MLNPQPAAFIFDMDGTLLDTEPLYTAASQKVLDPYGVEYTLELKRKCMGGDSRLSAQITIDHYQLPLTAEEYLAKREAFLQELFPTADEMPGAGDFIQSLGRLGIKLGVATSSHQHLYDLKMSKRPWGQHFDVVVCGDDNNLKRGKPAPDIFLLCAEKLGVDASQCLAFEDSPNGVNAAIAAGMQVVAINSPYVKPGELSAAEICIDHYSALADFVNSLRVEAS